MKYIKPIDIAMHLTKTKTKRISHWYVVSENFRSLVGKEQHASVLYNTQIVKFRLHRFNRRKSLALRFQKFIHNHCTPAKQASTLGNLFTVFKLLNNQI